MKLEGLHVGFPRQITGKRACYQADGNWETTVTEEVIWAIVMQLEAKYIGNRQEMVAQWVALCPFMEVYAREIGYEGGGQK